MNNPPKALAYASIAFVIVSAGQAFSETKSRSEEERCRTELSASRAVAEDSVNASKTYKTTGSDADFCKIIPASARSIAAGRKAIKSCQRLYPQEMAEEHAKSIEFEKLINSQRKEFALRCTDKVQAAVVACDEAAKDMVRRHNQAINAYASLHDHAPTSQTCSDLKYLSSYIDANRAVIKACRGAASAFYDADVNRQLIAKVSEKISDFRAKYPGACRSG